MELSIVDKYQDYLEAPTCDEVAMATSRRDGFAQMAELVIEWAPAGLEGPNDED
ncbi:MAG: hypothetical protein JKY86_15350 [Gammaproteobacteria bacterium]|nr:hypothetical protein [Gammaproteobacteria bacterium]